MVHLESCICNISHLQRWRKQHYIGSLYSEYVSTAACLCPWIRVIHLYYEWITLITVWWMINCLPALTHCLLNLLTTALMINSTALILSKVHPTVFNLFMSYCRVPVISCRRLVVSRLQQFDHGVELCLLLLHTVCTLDSLRRQGIVCSHTCSTLPVPTSLKWSTTN